jgi:hypothetical protein
MKSMAVRAEARQIEGISQTHFLLEEKRMSFTNVNY